MQLTPRYLVNNKTTLIANDAGFITEYRTVYQRHIKVYRGIDNVLQFKILNHDQKPVDITTKTPKFVVFDANKQMIIERDATVTDDGSTTTRGNCKVTVTENDLLNVKQQYLRYNIYLVDSANNKTITYVDSHFDNNATIFVDSYAFPGPSDTYSVSVFTEDSGKAGLDDSVWYSESVSAEPAINAMLHYRL